MKHITTIAFMLVCATISAQDTLCVMITFNEVINFDFDSSEVIDRAPLTDVTTLRVDSGEVMCLHLYDGKRRFRHVTTFFDDGDHSHDTLESKDDVYFSPLGYGMDIEIGDARKRKKQ
jgi:hypothetical protein